MPSDESTVPPGPTPPLLQEVAFVDMQLRIADASAGFAALVGLSGDRLLGAEVGGLLPAASPALAPLVAAALASGEPAGDLELWAPDGCWLAAVHPIRSRSGRVVGADLLLSRSTGRAQPGALGERLPELPLANEELLLRVADHATIGVLIGTRDGATIYTNPELRRMLGYRPDSFPATWMAITPPEYAERDAQAVEELKRAGVCQPYEKEYLASDGRRVPVLVGAAVLDVSATHTRLVAAFVTDLTALRRAEAARARAGTAAEQAARRAERLQELTAALSRALTPEAVASVVIESGLDALGAVAGTVMQLDPDGESLSILAATGLREDSEERWRRTPLEAPTPLTDAARRGEPVWLENLAARAAIYPHLDREAPYEHERAWAALPLSVNQRLIGGLGLIFDEARRFTDEERTFIVTVAELCAQALERARLSAAERAALAAADEALALLDTVINSAPIGLAFLDTEFRYRRVNETLARMNRLPAADHIGRRARELFPRAAAVWEPYWRQVIAAGEPVIGLEIGGPAMGIDTYALVSYYPVRAAGGELLGVGVIVQDITGRKRAEQERLALLASERAAREAEQAARARAEEAVQLRDSFLSVAAHELKTPLTALIGQAQLLRRRLDQSGALSEPNERAVGVVIGQAQRLNQLINDLLDGARIEAGQLNVSQAPLDLGQLLRRAAEDLQPSLVRHQLLVEIAGEPLRVAGDAVRLEQVVQNLLNNAVKYSPRGGPVWLRAARAGAMARISVSDEGIGIEPDAIPRLFERFYRAPGAKTAQVSGVGVGLYVVREIVRQHGGAVAVESQVGAGSTFTVTLPLLENGEW